MFKGTTPSLTLTFDNTFGLDFLDATSVVVTFATDYQKVLFEKSDDELILNGRTITINFTQEETLSFAPGKMLVQMNALLSDGSRICSDIGTICWNTNLKNEVMS